MTDSPLNLENSFAKNNNRRSLFCPSILPPITFQVNEGEKSEYVQRILLFYFYILFKPF